MDFINNDMERFKSIAEFESWPYTELTKLLSERWPTTQADDKESDDKCRDYTYRIKKVLYDTRHTIMPHIALEVLTHLGMAPSLLYDDDGRWIVGSCGMGSIRMSDEPQEMSLSFFLEDDAKWFPTIKEAVIDFLEEIMSYYNDEKS